MFSTVCSIIDVINYLIMYYRKKNVICFKRYSNKQDILMCDNLINNCHIGPRNIN